jgi:hypothetical protein
MTVAPPPPTGFGRVWPLLLFGLGVASVLWPLLGLPASFASFIAIVAFPKRDVEPVPGTRWWVAAGAVCAAVGMVRFIVSEAVPGIVGGGRLAVEDEAVSRLRDVLFAEDAMRRAAWIDPDHDGIGSAASLSELCGGPPERGQPERATPVLHCGELVPTRLGPAARSGAYLYTLCLPLTGGGWSAREGTVDDELAERRFVAYAWPDAGGSFERSFFIDEHENIRVVESRGAPASCEAALGGAAWPAWKNKKPRAELPGDVTVRAGSH